MSLLSRHICCQPSDQPNNDVEMDLEESSFADEALLVCLGYGLRMQKCTTDGVGAGVLQGVTAEVAGS